MVVVGAIVVVVGARVVVVGARVVMVGARVVVVGARVVVVGARVVVVGAAPDRTQVRPEGAYPELHVNEQSLALVPELVNTPLAIAVQLPTFLHPLIQSNL